MFRILVLFIIFSASSGVLAHTMLSPALESLEYRYANAEQIANDAAGVPPAPRQD